jgi:hypothetical protein
MVFLDSFSGGYPGMHFQEQQSVYIVGDVHNTVRKSPVEKAWPIWLHAHNRRRQHHWDEHTRYAAAEQELKLADHMMSLSVESASDLAAIILAVTSFGEFDTPCELYQLLDRLARPVLMEREPPLCHGVKADQNCCHQSLPGEPL